MAKLHFEVAGIAVYEDPYAPLERINKDGETERVLFLHIRLPEMDRILVHPDRWEEFWLAVNQPDVYDHPDVRALFKGPRG